MITEILSSIKDDHKLTFSHWRYRLLHWFFGVNPKTPNESPLPLMFYTHYCPLFHVTNLIFLFSPLILILKTFLAIARYFSVYAVMFLTFVESFAAKMLENIKFTDRKKKKVVKVEETQTQAEKRLRNAKKQAIINEKRSVLPKLIFLANKDFVYFTNFDKFWDRTNVDFAFIEKDDVKKIWDANAARLKEEKQKADARKKQIQQQMTFWVNFSRIFIKGLLNTVYCLMGCLVIYLVFKFTVPFCGFLWMTLTFMKNIIVSMFSIDFFWLFYFLVGLFIKAIATTAVCFGVYALLVRIPYGAIGRKIFFPVGLVGQMALALRSTIIKIGAGTYEFVSMFYEENCPAIVIVAEIPEENVEEES